MILFLQSVSVILTMVNFFLIKKKEQSIPDTIAGGQAVLKIVDGVSAALSNDTLAKVSAPFHCKREATRITTHRLVLGGRLDELLSEVVPVLVVGSLLNDNLLEVVRELEDDVLVLLGQLQVIVGSYAFLRNGRSTQAPKLLAVIPTVNHGSSFVRKPPSKVGGAHHRHRGVQVRRLQQRQTRNSREIYRGQLRTRIETGKGKTKKVSNQYRAGPSWRKLTMIAVKVRRRGARMRGGGGRLRERARQLFWLNQQQKQREGKEGCGDGVAGNYSSI